MVMSIVRMGVGVFCNSFLKEVSFKSYSGLSGPLQVRFYSTAQKVGCVAERKITESKESAESQSHLKKVQSFKEYKNSPIVKELFKDGDLKKIRQAYDEYRICASNRHRQYVYGGNPATLL